MKINKILTFLLFGLILVILIELGIIFIGGSSSVFFAPPKLNKIQTSTRIIPSEHIPNQTEWEPSTINYTISNQFGKIYIALGRLKKIENQKQLRVALVGREIIFEITQETEFLTRIHFLNSLPQQITEKQPFKLNINQVYLFEWKGENSELNKVISIWRITRLKNRI